jgi:hypothetical protein
MSARAFSSGGARRAEGGAGVVGSREEAAPPEHRMNELEHGASIPQPGMPSR